MDSQKISNENKVWFVMVKNVLRSNQPVIEFMPVDGSRSHGDLVLPTSDYVALPRMFVRSDFLDPADTKTVTVHSGGFSAQHIATFREGCLVSDKPEVACKRPTFLFADSTFVWDDSVVLSPFGRIQRDANGNIPDKENSVMKIATPTTLKAMDNFMDGLISDQNRRRDEYFSKHSDIDKSYFTLLEKPLTLKVLADKSLSDNPEVKHVASYIDSLDNERTEYVQKVANGNDFLYFNTEDIAKQIVYAASHQDLYTQRGMKFIMEVYNDAMANYKAHDMEDTPEVLLPDISKSKSVSLKR